MAGVLGVSILGVTLDARLGWIGSVLLLGLGLSSITWPGRLARSSGITYPQLAVSLGLLIGAVFGFYSGGQRIRSEWQRESWQRSVTLLGESLSDLQWHPVVLRGVVVDPVRYRRAMMQHPQLGPGVLPRVAKASPGETPEPRADRRTDQPETIDWQSMTVLQVEEVRSGGTWRPVNALVPLTIDGRVSSLLPGDSVEVYCQWKLPSRAGNPGQFDLAARFAELGYSAQAKTTSEEQIVRLDRPTGWRVDRFFAWVGQVALEGMEKHVILGQSPLACALILGQRDMVAWRLQEDLLATGSIHMLSISGMHIEMISTALLLLGAIGMVNRRWLLWGICLVIWGYTMICGTNPPVLRAAIMLTVASLARSLHWQTNSMNNLCLAGFLIMAGRPSVLFELGTQLSFLAVAVLIVTGERVLKRVTPLSQLIELRTSSRWKQWKAIARWCIEMLRTSFWVWFITAPLVWTGFHVISPIAILLNLILWLPMLVALIAGLGMILLGWFPPVGVVLGALCGVMLWIVDAAVDLGEKVPWGHFWSSSPSTLWMLGFYGLGLIVTAANGMKRRVARRRILTALSAWFAFGVLSLPVGGWIESWRNDHSRLSITFIDVGHGCHVWIEMPDKRLWCYDAGRMGDHERSYRPMVEALWAEEILSMDTLVLSHGDSDHYNGIPGIHERFTIRRMVSTPRVMKHTDPIVQGIVQGVKRKGTKLEEWTIGHVEKLGDCRVTVLHPQSVQVGKSDNADSLCLLVEFGGRRILLPGDLEQPGTSVLTSAPPTQVDILLAPHHGSLQSAGDLLLDWCHPDEVIISGSTRTLSPKVEDLYGGGGRRVWRTVRERALRFEITSEGEMTASTWHSFGRWGMWREVANR